MNVLDVVGIALIGVTATLLLGNLDSIPALDWLPLYLRDSPVLLLSVTAVVFLSKTTLGILLARQTGLFLARAEVHNSNLVARTVFSGGLESTKGLSRSKVEWLVLRSTAVAFAGVLSHGIAFLAEVSLALFVFCLMLFADWQATLLITFYFALILAVFQWFSSKRVQAAGSALSLGSVSVSQVITDLVNAFREISVLHKIDYFLGTLAQARLSVARSHAISTYLQSIPRLLVETSLILGALIFLAWEIVRSEGNGDFAALGILLVGSLRIMGALLPLQRSFAELRFIQPQAEGAHEVLEKNLTDVLIMQEGLETITQPRSQAPESGLRIELSGASFAFDDGRGVNRSQDSVTEGFVIDNVSMLIEPGDYVALVGPSGAGKSTLVDLILGLYKPQSGTVMIEGTEPREYIASHPGAVGYVPQKPGLVSGTIKQNIALGVDESEVDEEAVWAAIQTSQLEDFVFSLPDGIESDLGANADSLSGGQKQRLGLARALYGKPKFLVLDEATSALDAQTEASVTESLAGLRGEVTVLVVAHRLSTVQRVDKAYVLESGKIMASGPFSKLRKEVPLIQSYIELMSFD